MAGGSAYVKVQAMTSTYSTRSVGSAGSITLTLKINWAFEGGISGQYGWDYPKKVEWVKGDVAATDAAVTRAYSNATKADLNAIHNCYDLIWV